MANKLAEGAVARVEQIGGLLEKVVGKVIGSERLQERGQEHIEHAQAVRADAQPDAVNAEPEAADESWEPTPAVTETAREGQVVGVWEPDKKHHRRRYGL